MFSKDIKCYQISKIISCANKTKCKWRFTDLWDGIFLFIRIICQNKISSPFFNKDKQNKTQWSYDANISSMALYFDSCVSWYVLYSCLTIGLGFKNYPKLTPHMLKSICWVLRYGHFFSCQLICNLTIGLSF